MDGTYASVDASPFGTRHRELDQSDVVVYTAAEDVNGNPDVTYGYTAVTERSTNANTPGTGRMRQENAKEISKATTYDRICQ